LATLVIQSFRTIHVPSWIDACLKTVRQWSQVQGYEYRFVGDEIFELVPDWYLDKSGRGPVATDYGRLVLLKQALTEGYDKVVWLDADIYVMDAGMQLEFEKSCAFGHETWIQEESGKMQARRNVHNAVCVFRQGCAVLPFLMETTASIIRRANPDKIAPQMVGPKLLSALHSLYEFDLLPQVGMVSPALARALIQSGGEALTLWRQKTPCRLQAANLCTSLMDDRDGEKVIGQLGLLQ